MVPTLEYIKRKFAEYNALMFEGKLQPLPFRLSNGRTFLGKIAYRKTRGLLGKMHYSNFQFVISTRYDLPEREVEDTIIHEMIHYYILSNQLKDTAPHGVLFQRMMNDINQRFGRNISVSHRRTNEESDSDQNIRQHIVCVSHLQDGRSGVTVVARTRLFMMWDAMQQFPGVKDHRWVVTTDPYFNRFPRALTPKIYPVPAAELEEHLHTAVPLERVGNTIRTQKVTTRM